jgi:hypothetical protein
MREAAQALLARKAGCLYRNVLSSRTHFLFKHELLRARTKPPQVVAVGSSRMLLFHRRMFSRSFLNMGRAANRLREALHTLKRLGELDPPPRVIMLGVDFWWFHPRRARHPGQTLSPLDISPDNYADVMRMLRKGLERPAYLLHAWRRESCSLGVDAILYERGFDKWGFMYMGALPAAAGRRGFADVLARIRDGRDKFERADVPDSEMLEALVDTLKALRRRGILVLAFLPPLPGEVMSAMEGRGYGYVEKVRAAFHDGDVPFIDYHAPGRRGAFDACQFVDGIHQGDTVNARILLDFLELVPELSAYLNRPFLEWLAGFRQQALVMNSLRLKQPEADFLGLGCRKVPVVPKTGPR